MVIVFSGMLEHHQSVDHQDHTRWSKSFNGDVVTGQGDRAWLLYGKVKPNQRMIKGKYLIDLVEGKWAKQKPWPITGKINNEEPRAQRAYVHFWHFWVGPIRLNLVLPSIRGYHAPIAKLLGKHPTRWFLVDGRSVPRAQFTSFNLMGPTQKCTAKNGHIPFVL